MGTDSASSVGPGRLPGEVKRPSRHRPAVTVSDSPGFLLNQAVLTLNGSLDRALAPSLTGAQWTAVWLLHERRISTASELARAVGTDVAAAWRLAGRLADKGYLARSPDPADRRAVQLSLTPAAVEACPAWRATVAATLAGLLDDVATEDLPILNRVLVRIVANGAGAPDTYPPAAPPVRGATPAQPQERNRR
jgi:DNA-binding MarR family transcriptional regulator